MLQSYISLFAVSVNRYLKIREHLLLIVTPVEGVEEGRKIIPYCSFSQILQNL